MYKRDIEDIIEHIEASPEGLVDCVEFVLCSIRASLSSIKEQRKDIASAGLKSKYLWGQKSAGLAYVREHKTVLWLNLLELKEQSTSNPKVIVQALKLAMAIPNIGLVKAGFILQLMGFDVACLDMHNLERLGLAPNAFSINAKLKEATQTKKMIAYVKLCQKKGTEYWWNSWCDYVAGNRMNKNLSTGDLVSRYHVHLLTNFKSI